MRDQYVGDISDVLKFAFLRALIGDDRSLGIAWYYVPEDDGRSDGRHLEWMEDAAWKKLDPVLHAGLTGLSGRSIAALEQTEIWPLRTRFHRDPVPDRGERMLWSEQKAKALESADVVFLDPDNGIGEGGKKHATFSEIRRLRREERAIVFITFPGRKKHVDLVEQLHNRLKVESEAKTVLTLRTSVSVPRALNSPYVVQRQRWFTIVDPDETLITRSRSFAASISEMPRVRVDLDLSR